MTSSDVYPHPDPRFCHQCGEPMQLQHVPDEGRERLVCQSCSFIHYLNPRVVAAALPERRGDDGRRHVLLMRRALEPRRGYWTPPGGFVEWGESAEEAALREGEEEVGLRLEMSALLGVYSRSAYGIIVVAYRARALGGDPEPSDEALEVKWFSEDNIPWEDLAFETTVAALKDWVAGA